MTEYWEYHVKQSCLNCGLESYVAVITPERSFYFCQTCFYRNTKECIDIIHDEYLKTHILDIFIIGDYNGREENSTNPKNFG